LARKLVRTHKNVFMEVLKTVLDLGENKLRTIKTDAKEEAVTVGTSERDAKLIMFCYQQTATQQTALIHV
jgi:hypothetical protein